MPTRKLDPHPTLPFRNTHPSHSQSPDRHPFLQRNGARHPPLSSARRFVRRLSVASSVGSRSLGTCRECCRRRVPPAIELDGFDALCRNHAGASGASSTGRRLTTCVTTVPSKDITSVAVTRP